MKSKILGLLSVGLLAGPLAAQAAPVVFDFEAETAGNKGSAYVLTSGGVTLTISRVTGNVEVRSIGSFAGSPASWGNNALSPFLATSGSPFVLTFSRPFSSITVDVGDFAPSDADDFEIRVGADVDSGSQLGSVGFPTFHTLSLTGLNATQAIFSGGSASFPQSVFWDNIRIDLAAVPEPGMLALLGLGLAGLGLSRRRKTN